MIKMSKNLFEQIDEEKKDIPKIDKALKLKKEYNERKRTKDV